jgi:hypothetical protein
VCELAKDFGAYRGKTIAVRGIYTYFSLRQACEQQCSNGPWPSFVDLSGGDRVVWDELAAAEEKARELLLQSNKHSEIWVTVTGRLHAADGDPCDWKRRAPPGYGHLNSYPAEIEVTSFSAIELVESQDSPFGYGSTSTNR